MIVRRRPYRRVCSGVVHSRSLPVVRAGPSSTFPELASSHIAEFALRVRIIFVLLFISGLLGVHRTGLRAYLFRVLLTFLQRYGVVEMATSDRINALRRHVSDLTCFPASRLPRVVLVVPLNFILIGRDDPYRVRTGTMAHSAFTLVHTSARRNSRMRRTVRRVYDVLSSRCHTLTCL